MLDRPCSDVNTEWMSLFSCSCSAFSRACETPRQRRQFEGWHTTCVHAPPSVRSPSGAPLAALVRIGGTQPENIKEFTRCKHVPTLCLGRLEVLGHPSTIVMMNSHQSNTQLKSTHRLAPQPKNKNKYNLRDSHSPESVRRFCACGAAARSWQPAQNVRGQTSSALAARQN